MFYIKTLSTLALVVALAGCASSFQQPISLSANTFANKGTRFGVAMTSLPKVDTVFPGADCLLCLATASLVNNRLTSHTQKLTYEDLTVIKNVVAEKVRKKGADVIVIPDEIKLDELPTKESAGENVAKRDFSLLGKKYNVDKLIVLDVGTLGIWRSYSGYFPSGDPYAKLEATGYMVNLNGNAYEWYHRVHITKGGGLNWDEPPEFPGLTNAYYQTIELGKDALLNPFN